MRQFEAMQNRLKIAYLAPEIPALSATFVYNEILQLEESGYKGHGLEQLLVRIMFCLFADDTGIFQPDSFLRYIEDRTSEGGSDLGPHLMHLFQILDWLLVTY